MLESSNRFSTVMPAGAVIAVPAPTTKIASRRSELLPAGTVTEGAEGVAVMGSMACAITSSGLVVLAPP